ncbi:MAG: class I SAM-dependent methyltransferase [Caldilineaceae bacterium]|nr:class I SAM-dependent methyltransferase [Caldilineaceae bacterium]
MLTWREQWEAHYASGHTPWDTQITPPEVQAFWSSGRLPGRGLGLDIGCGPGTNVLFLARQGLAVIGFDIAAQPVQIGRQRIRERAPELLARTLLVQADVTALPVHQANASYILDVGCFHGLHPDNRPAYVQHVVNNLAVGGYYQLYAFDRAPEMTDDPDKKLRGMEENEVAERFAPWMAVVEIVRAEPDRYPCRWYLLQRRECS